MKRNAKTLLAVCVVAVAATLMEGCMWSRARLNDPEIVERASAIVPGVTKVADLPRLLQAQPTRKRKSGNDLTLEYSYSDSKTKVFTLIIVSFSRTESVTETLYVEADAETGVVTQVPRQKRHEPEWRFWPFGDDE